MLFPREEEIESLTALNLKPDFYDGVFRESGLELIRKICPQARETI